MCDNSADKSLIEDLVKKADNWTLAGNAELLKVMEKISKGILENIEKTNTNLNRLVDSLDESSIQLDLVRNRFLGLQNTQFIESRVYEEDESVNEPINNNPSDSKQSDEDSKKFECFKQIVSDGIEVLDKYYDRISISDSDSDADDETDYINRRFILQKKDLYAHRPLPCVIGSDEWYKEWSHEAPMDGYDDDDEEINSINGDAYESLNKNQMGDEKVLSDESKSVSNFSINSNDVLNSNLVNPYVPNENLREQIDSEEVNRRKIQKPSASTNTFFGTFASEEPPPLFPEENESLKSHPRGLFDSDSDSESEITQNKKISSLFDEDDHLNEQNINDIPSNEKNTMSKSEKSPITGGFRLFPSDFTPKMPSEVSEQSKETPEIKNIKQTLANIPVEEEKPKTRGLFDSDSDSETKTPKTKENLFDETEKTEIPKDLNIKTDKTKVPGGFRLFPSDFNPKSLNVPTISPTISSTNIPKDKNPNKNIPNTEIQQKTLPALSVDFTQSITTKKLGLFDEDTNDLFKDDDLFFEAPSETLKTVQNTSKTTKNLFESDDDEEDLSMKPPPIISDEPKQKKVRNLFDDDFSSDEIDEEDIFGESITSSSKSHQSDERKRLNLFDDTPPPFTPSKSSKKELSTEVSTENISTIVKKEQKPQTKQKISLFDDDFDEDKEDLLFKDETIEQTTNKLENFNKSLFSDQVVDDPSISNRFITEKPVEKTLRAHSLFSDDETDDIPVSTPSITDNQLSSPIANKQLSFFSSIKNEDTIKSSSITQAGESPPKQTVDTKIATSSNEKPNTIGKLKPNLLNINVTALMPGAQRAPPNKTPIVPLDGADDDDLLVATQTTEILSSVTKDRPRITAGNRRPSTRRGRQEMLKKNVQQDVQQVAPSQDGVKSYETAPSTDDEIPSHESSSLTRTVNETSPLKSSAPSYDDEQSNQEPPIGDDTKFAQSVVPELKFNSGVKKTINKGLFDDVFVDEVDEDLFEHVMEKPVITKTVTREAVISKVSQQRSIDVAGIESDEAVINKVSKERAIDVARGKPDEAVISNVSKERATDAASNKSEELQTSEIGDGKFDLFVDSKDETKDFLIKSRITKERRLFSDSSSSSSVSSLNEEDVGAKSLFGVTSKSKPTSIEKEQKISRAKNVEKKKTLSLFDDDENEDAFDDNEHDLFGSKKVTEKLEKLKKTKRKSLFDDVDDHIEDDSLLFSSENVVKNKPGLKTKTSIKSAASPNVDFDDPLDVFSNK